MMHSFLTVKNTLFVLNFFNMGSVVSLLLLLPFVQKELGLTLVDIGLLSATLTVSSIVSSVFTSKIQRKIGTQKAFLISLCLIVSAWICVQLIHIPLFIWLVFIFAGLSSGLFGPIANALVAKTADDKKIAQVMGDFTAVSDLGRIVMTTFTGIVAGLLGWRASSIIYTIIGLLLIAVYLHLHARQKVNIKKETQIEPSTLRELIANKPFILTVIMGVIDTFSSVSLFIFLPFLLVNKGINLESSGWFTALFFLGFFTGRLVLGRFADRKGAVRTFIFAEIIMALLIFSLIFLSSFWLIIINLFILGIVARGTSPIQKAMIVQSIEKHDLEKGFAFSSVWVRTANAISRSIFGFIGALWGVESIFIACGLAALLTIVPAIGYHITTKNKDILS